MIGETYREIPAALQRQPTDAKRRMCGAAALAMALTKLGRPVPLETVWEGVAGADPYGTQAARSFQLAAFARRFGFAAAVLQAEPRRAWQALQRSASLGLAVILNHRIALHRDEGHFTTLVSQHSDHLIVDDPGWGPDRRIERRELEALWQPLPGGEISGQVLIAIGPDQQASPHRRRAIDGICHRCDRPFACTPAALFTPADWLTYPLWRRFFCLHCDASFSPA
jgi:ABC-type bacteriocin/lantibiotic exporter with double-glycine peptidase domain